MMGDYSQDSQELELMKRVLVGGYQEVDGSDEGVMNVARFALTSLLTTTMESSSPSSSVPHRRPSYAFITETEELLTMSTSTPSVEVGVDDLFSSRGLHIEVLEASRQVCVLECENQKNKKVLPHLFPAQYECMDFLRLFACLFSVLF